MEWEGAGTNAMAPILDYFLSLNFCFDLGTAWICRVVATTIDVLLHITRLSENALHRSKSRDAKTRFVLANLQRGVAEVASRIQQIQ